MHMPTDASGDERKRHVLRPVITRGLVFASAAVLFTGVALADPTPTATAAECSDFTNQMGQVRNILLVALLAIAAPNGIYGLIEYMTAGSSVDQDEKGRKRIRHTLIAVGGAGALIILIQLVAQVVGIANASC